MNGVYAYLLSLVLIITAFEIIKTPIHEFIHYIFLKKYNPNKDIKTSFIIEAPFNIYASYSDIKFVKRRFFKGGCTKVSNDFLTYNDKQIRIIAIAPTAFIFLAFTLFNFTSIQILLPKQLLGNLTAIFKIFIFIITSGYYFICLTASKLPYSDLKIFFDPKGFKEYMAEQHKNKGTESYYAQN